jgi:hypothetical protein
MCHPILYFASLPSLQHSSGKQEWSPSHLYFIKCLIPYRESQFSVFPTFQPSTRIWGQTNYRKPLSSRNKEKKKALQSSIMSYTEQTNIGCLKALSRQLSHDTPRAAQFISKQGERVNHCDCNLNYTVLGSLPISNLRLRLWSYLSSAFFISLVKNVSHHKPNTARIFTFKRV